MQELVDKVIEQIKQDFIDGDVTALEELLFKVSKENLIAFLPEEDE